MIPFLHRVAPSTLEDNPLWLVVLCDMMTNLMLFFLVMFALTQQGPQAQRDLVKTFEAGALVDRKPRAEEAALPTFRESDADRLRGVFTQGGLGEAAAVAETEEGVRVRLKEGLLFGFGEADLAANAGTTLERLAAVLREMPNSVVVEGHTDDRPVIGGRYRSNWELSIARSHAVLSALVAAGVHPKRLVTSGYGPLHPIASNGDDAGRAKNRRVEIVILRHPEEERGA
ncbi:MAG: OmpA family protein [Elusimicrobiota bacterium]|jgi:chemotaxis protein MotB